LRLFVDTSVWYAFLDEDDGSHSAAVGVLRTDADLALSDHVLVETCLLAAARLGRGVANRFWDRVMAGAADLHFVTMADLERATQVRRSFPDQGFSLVDCTSFVVMERLRLQRVASFDDDFALYRFGPDRRQAFEVIR
jgi:predicted nucleic acid-binding protein